MKWNRFELAHEWFRRVTRKTKYLANLDTTIPGAADALKHAYIMGYNARERQENWQRAKDKANADRRTKP